MFPKISMCPAAFRDPRRLQSGFKTYQAVSVKVKRRERVPDRFSGLHRLADELQSNFKGLYGSSRGFTCFDFF